MSDFLKQKSIKCFCKANSKVYEEDGKKFEFTYKEYFSNIENPQKIDILILLEFKETKTKYEIFERFCNSFFKEKSFVIIPALGCTPKDFSAEDTIGTYEKCKHLYIKKNIEKYSPKIIITVGRALYTITETKDLNYSHFFIPVNESLKDYQIDDSWMFSSEFNCKVIPIPPLYQWISETEKKYKDTYEFKFAFQQFKRSLEFLKLRNERVPKLKYEIVQDVEAFLQKLINNHDVKEIAIDTESEGLNYFNDKLFSIQMAFNEIEGYFFLFDKSQIELLIQLFDCKEKYIIMQNGSHDLKFLKSNGVFNARCDFDTMLASWQLNENSPQGLKPNCWIYTNYGGYEEEMKRYMNKHNISDFTKVPLDLLIKYSTYDANIAFQLYKYFKTRLDQEDEDVRYNFYEYVMPALEMITDVEMTGVPTDLKYLYEYNENLKNEFNETEKRIFEITGKKFNISSKKELSGVLRNLSGFVTLKDDKGEEIIGKTGDLILNKETYYKYEQQGSEIIMLIKKINHVAKEISQLGITPKENSKYRNFLSEENGEQENFRGFMKSFHNKRLYTSYKLYGTDTGRMSGGKEKEGNQSVKLSKNDSFGINPQNLPVKETFRKVFLPPSDFILGTADYDAMEVCIFSQLAGKGTFEDIILSGKDLHCYTSMSLFHELSEKEIKTFYKKFIENLPLKKDEDIEKYIKTLDIKNITYDIIKENVTKKDPFFKTMRDISKKVNWKCLYNATAFGLAKELEADIETGETVLRAFKSIYPDINTLMARQVEFAKTNGYVKTLLGRKRRLPQLTYIGNDSWKNYSSFRLYNIINNAINSPVQGTSGQTTVIAMTKIWQELNLRSFRTKILINVHDEIVFIIHKDEIIDVKEIVEKHMKNLYYINRDNNQVRLNAELEIGEVWKNCKPVSQYDSSKLRNLIDSINKRNGDNLKFIGETG